MIFSLEDSMSIKSFIALIILSVSCTQITYGLEMSQLDFKPDVVYGHKHGMALTFDVFQPKENMNGAGILVMVSGGMNSSWMPPEQMLPWISSFLDNGYTVFTIRHGSSPKYVVPEIIGDVLRSVRYIRLNAKSLKIDPKRLGVLGFSSGGHLTMSIATMADDGDPKSEDPVLQTSNRVTAVVAYFPATDIREWVKKDHPMNEKFPALKFDESKAEEFSPCLQVTADDAPALLIHGDQDKLVPVEHSYLIRDAYKENNVPVKLIVIEGAGHGFKGEDQKRAGKATLEWFDRYLNK
jgi:acetyl esterase/lipase